MESLQHPQGEGKNRPNTKSKDLKPTKETKNQCSKTGTISPSSARKIDEIVIKHKTALEILANS